MDRKFFTNTKAIVAALVLFCLAIVLMPVVSQLEAEAPKEDVQQGEKSKLPVETASIKLKSGATHAFELEIAKSPVDVQMGLMFRKSMEPDHGMMFQFTKEPRKISFWMKNTYIPLDLLFIAGDGRIVNIHRNATPHSTTSIPSVEPVTGVIEINGGRSDELGIKIGDTVAHPYFSAAEKK